VFEGLSREQRKVAAAYARAAAKKRPVVMTEIPREHWPDLTDNTERFAVFHSRRFLAQVFLAPVTYGVICRRVSVCRVTLQADGHWEENIEWEDLMLVKREIGYGDWYAVEVYPRDQDIVNVCNLRHLWVFEQPLPIGWFR